jgi:hypothetical protein
MFLGHVARAAQTYSDVPGTMRLFDRQFRHASANSLPAMTGELDAKLSGTKGFRRDLKTQGKLLRVPVERVDLLRTGVAEQKR